MDARTEFLLALGNGPLFKGGAAVVLMGEDWQVRLRGAAEVLQSQGAPVVLLTGGRHDPPALMDAEHGSAALLGMGVAPDRILVLPRAQNTREQAEDVVAFAVENTMKRLLLLVSAYHLPRAFLTFVRLLRERDMHEQIEVIPIPVGHAPWWRAVPGMIETRMEQAAVEFVKIMRYERHVATYEEGVEYLRFWEGKWPLDP